MEPPIDWRLDLAHFREKRDLSFDDLAGLVKKMQSRDTARKTN